MFVARNAKGDVVAAWTARRHRDQAEVSNTDVALQAYLNKTPLSRALFSTVGISIDDVHSLATRAGRYIDRVDGGIVAVHEFPQRDQHEFLPLDSVELQAFVEGRGVFDPPAGFAFKKMPGSVERWRIVRDADAHTMVEGLASLDACLKHVAWHPKDYAKQAAL